MTYLSTRKTQVDYLSKIERIKQAKLRKAAAKYWAKLLNFKKVCLD